ncbi:MAG: phage portal protein, partial [Eubacterium sp.]|nr:phage portal protein [Eubacterium sp.]
FFSRINVGGNQTGLYSFISTYLSDLLTYGSAVGEMIADENGFYALYNGELDALEVKRASNNLDVEFYNGNEKLSNQDLILFSALNPEPGKILGTSLLRGLPFVSDVLLTIYNTIGENWSHAGNLRYAVTYKPSDSIDSGNAKERAEQMAEAWKDAMSSKDTVKDFVAVGDVSVKVIGADSGVLNSEVPVKQLMEQIIAKTGLPPYMLGLSWSTTERMSSQQADVLTTELEAYRRILDPVLLKIGKKYLEINGIGSSIEIVWDSITMQDETEMAKARLYDAQTEKILREVYA